MTFQTQTYLWHLISQVPKDPGIYSWYYKPNLPDQDISDLAAQLRGLDPLKGCDLVRNFLKRHVFNPLADSPYSATISGALKPTYDGELHVRMAVSEDLVERIVANPDRLRRLKEVFEASVPEFSSPIYIGMAVNLRRRLETHKATINRLKDAPEAPPHIDADGEDDQRSAHSFAKEVVRRQLSVNRLLVVVRKLNQNGDECKDAENVLNRINFPICGRN